MFILYHSERCNTSGRVFQWCYVNDLRTTTCSDMLGHRRCLQKYMAPRSITSRKKCYRSRTNGSGCWPAHATPLFSSGHSGRSGRTRVISSYWQRAVVDGTRLLFGPRLHPGPNLTRSVHQCWPATGTWVPVACRFICRVLLWHARQVHKIWSWGVPPHMTSIGDISFCGQAHPLARAIRPFPSFPHKFISLSSTLPFFLHIDLLF
jgi:hypothetical protein